jgi:hypothetical protein
MIGMLVRRRLDLPRPLPLSPPSPLARMADIVAYTNGDSHPWYLNCSIQRHIRNLGLPSALNKALRLFGSVRGPVSVSQTSTKRTLAVTCLPGRLRVHLDFISG